MTPPHSLLSITSRYQTFHEVTLNIMSILKLSSSPPGREDIIVSCLIKLRNNLTILRLIFTQMLQSRCVEDEWNVAYVHSKAHNRSLVTHYSPFLLTSIPSELHEHIVQETSSVNFYPHQNGFHNLYSCQTQLTKITHDIKENGP